MSTPASVEELLQLIRKSGMVDEQKLSSYLQRREAGRGLPEDPREAADAMIQDGLITGFQAEQFLLGKWRGFTIGKYKLLERVGVGGMGQVFLCEHTFMKRRVAIKVLPPAKAEQPAALGRFYREARAAGSIEHPNIVRTHDIDQDGNLHFIVMEYVDGSNLLDITKKFGPLDIYRVASYIRQVAEGLDYAFRNGIIHRDIKPGNILIDRHGKAKLLDMGLARFYNDHSDNLTIKYDDKIVLGTADYVAPEQVANSHAVDIRADIYALGASMYFLLAGHPPFPSGTVSQKLLWHRTKDPTPIRQVRPQVPEAMAAIITKMMQKDPNKRYQTPGEVADALEPWTSSEIPLPNPQEMPLLSPAAMEGVEDALPVERPSVKAPLPSPSTHSISMSATATATAQSRSVVRPSPFGAPAAVAVETPEPAAIRTEAPVHAESQLAGATRPRTSWSSPFGAVEAPAPEAAPQAAQAQPVPFRLPATKQGPAPQPFLRVEGEDRADQIKKYIFYGLITASAVLAVGLLSWKFVFAPKAKPPADAIVTPEAK